MNTIAPKLLKGIELTSTNTCSTRFSWLEGQKSRSGSDGRENLVNLLDLELLQAFEQKLTNILTTLCSKKVTPK